MTKLQKKSDVKSDFNELKERWKHQIQNVRQ